MTTATIETKHDPNCDCGICAYCHGQEDVNGNPLAAIRQGVAALAYTIRNAVANGAAWSPDIVAWANSLRRTQPDNVPGGELVRAAIDAEAVTTPDDEFDV